MILLDTCAFIWLVQQPAKLSKRATKAIQAHDGNLHVSAATAWEIAIKAANNQYTIPPDMTPLSWFTQVLAEYGIAEISVDASIFCRAAALPPIHRDPCDRLLIATAITHHLTIITADTIIPQYPNVKIIW